MQKKSCFRRSLGGVGRGLRAGQAGGLVVHPGSTETSHLNVVQNTAQPLTSYSSLSLAGVMGEAWSFSPGDLLTLKPHIQTPRVPLVPGTQAMPKPHHIMFLTNLRI